MDDLYSLMMGAEPDAAQSAQAIAAAIRGNRQLAGINAVAGGGLGALGALQAGEAKQGNDLMEKGIIARMHYGEATKQAERDAKMRALEKTLAAKASEGAENRASNLERTLAMIAGQLAVARVKEAAKEDKKKALSAKEIEGLRSYDAALGRVKDMESMFDDKGIGTYPFANAIHGAANLVGVQDPKFDKLRALSQSHLLKGLKADVGGRITNFEIQYGKTMFPNETDRPASAKAKLSTVKQHLLQDRENAYRALEDAGRDMAALPFKPAAEDAIQDTPAPSPAKTRSFKRVNGKLVEE